MDLKFWKYIVLFILFCGTTLLYAQERKVSGTVTDKVTGETLIGVNILVKGTKTGIVTNIDGKYSLSVNSPNAVLVFSYIGMKTEEVPVNGKAVIDISLTADSKTIEEVMVIGYTSVRKKEVTGAVTQVKAKDISNLITSDLGNALQGMVSGVSVTSASGAPGAGSSILIRGVTSVNGNNTPLYVVDGVPQEGDPKISVNEIETIDILKDAASCAIYGSRGAAGVILITTKQGQAGKLKVSMNASYSVQHIISKNNLMDAVDQTYFDLIQRRNTDGKKDDDAILDLFQNKSYFQNNTDLFEQTFVDNASVQNYNINVSGGSENLVYSMTAGFYDKEGVIVNSNFQRFNTRSNFSYNKNKWHLGASMGMSKEDTQYSPWGIINQSIRYTPKQPTLNIDPDVAYQAADGNEQNLIGWVLQQYLIQDNQHMRNTFSNFNAAYDLANGLTISANFGINESNGYRKIFRPYQELKNSAGDVFSSPESSYVKMQSSNRESYSWAGTAQYKVTLAKSHNLTTFAGFTAEKYIYEGFNADKYGVSDNAISSLNGATLNAAASSDFNYVNTLIGTIGRVQYDWKQRYLLNVSVRRDGSSKFAKDNRWGMFPSASAAWNVTDEPFFKSAQKYVNNFKIRASYGTTGNQSFSPYTYTTSISSATGLGYVFGSKSLVSGSTQVAFANPNVKWETARQFNFGTDLAFLSNKITFSAEYYSTDKTDMLFPIEIPGSSGGTTNYNSKRVVLNVGDMTNSGIELAAEYRALIGDFSYGIKGTFSANHNEITHINGQGGFIYTNDGGLIPESKSTSQITVLAEGYEAGAFFLYRTDGIVDSHKKLADYQLIVPTARMGDLMYKDSNGDGKITDADLTYSGSGIPKYEVGCNLNFAYKGFDLNMNIYSALGHNIMNGSKAVSFQYGRNKDLVNSWTEANPNTTIPAYRGIQHSNYLGYTDLWLEDGSYIRLKQVSLGYSLSKKTLTALKLSQVRIYLSAQNPYTLTKYSGYDPEIGGDIGSRGLDKGNYPNSTLYTLGLNINL